MLGITKANYYSKLSENPMPKTRRCWQQDYSRTAPVQKNDPALLQRHSIHDAHFKIHPCMKGLIHTHLMFTSGLKEDATADHWGVDSRLCFMGVPNA